MFGANISDVYRYDYMAPKFKAAYEFLANTDFSTMEDQRIELEHGVYAMIQSYTTQPPQERQFETHDIYFDIQYLVSGEEFFGLASRSLLTVEAAYNPESDTTFYKTPTASGGICLAPGDFITVSPQEAHQPRAFITAPVAVKKVVVKVPAK